MAERSSSSSGKSPRLLTVRGAILAGSIGGLVYGLNFGTQALVGIFQMTGATGFISGLTVPFFLALASRINKQWGTATIIWTLYSAMAIPTVLMGTPGPYKLVVGLLGGLAYDLGYCGLRCRDYALYVGLLLYVTVMGMLFYAVYALGLTPEVSGGSVARLLVIVSTVFALEGLASTRLAIWFHENRVRKIQR